MIDTSTLEALKLHLDSNGAQAFHGDLESILPDIVSELIEWRDVAEDPSAFADDYSELEQLREYRSAVDGLLGDLTDGVIESPVFIQSIDTTREALIEAMK